MPLFAVLACAIPIGMEPMAQSRSLEAATGQQVFERLWVSSPASTKSSDGLGPLYNARSCAACHPGGGPGGDASLLLRLGRLPAGAIPATPDPIYGLQFQTRSVPGLPAEGELTLSYTEQYVTLTGEDPVLLRAPVPRIENPAYGPLDSETAFSLRIGPDLATVARIAAVPDAQILAMADPTDQNADGISGRINIVIDPATGAPAIGRFGHKASEASLRAQTASALFHDMGLSTSLHPEGHGACTQAQHKCRAAPDGNSPEHGNVEVPDPLLDLIEAYLLSLSPPTARPGSTPGQALFADLGCSACHTDAYGTDGPLSDLLLHDMGPGLADDRPEWGASGSEWRTAPLAGLRFRAGPDQPTHLLHDGRATSILEAILWHGGEAAPARDAVRALSPDERRTLIEYLETL